MWWFCEMILDAFLYCWSGGLFDRQPSKRCLKDKARLLKDRERIEEAKAIVAQRSRAIASRAKQKALYWADRNNVKLKFNREPTTQEWSEIGEQLHQKAMRENQKI